LTKQKHKSSMRETPRFGQ